VFVFSQVVGLTGFVTGLAKVYVKRGRCLL